MATVAARAAGWGFFVLLTMFVFGVGLLPLWFLLHWLHLDLLGEILVGTFWLVVVGTVFFRIVRGRSVPATPDRRD